MPNKGFSVSKERAFKLGTPPLAKAMTKVNHWISSDEEGGEVSHLHSPLPQRKAGPPAQTRGSTISFSMLSPCRMGERNDVDFRGIHRLHHVDSLCHLDYCHDHHRHCVSLWPTDDIPVPPKTVARPPGVSSDSQTVSERFSCPVLDEVSQ